MHFITHIFWNDIKRLKWLLVLFVGLLIWYWVMSCYAIGWVANDLLKGEQLTVLFTSLRWIINLLVLVILYLLVHPDSIARPTSFAWCRPISRSSALLAKTIFTVVILFALPVLTEIATYCYYNAPSEKVGFLLLEAGVYQFIFLVNAFLLATVVPRFKHFVGFGIVTVVLFLGFKGWLTSCWGGYHDKDAPGLWFYTFLFSFLLVLSSLNIFIILGQFHRVKFGRLARTLGINLVAVVVILRFYYPPVFHFREDIRPINSEVAKKLHVSLKYAGQEVAFGKASFRLTVTQNPESLHAGMEVIPEGFGDMTLTLPYPNQKKIDNEISLQVYHSYPMEDYIMGLRNLFPKTKLLNERVYFQEEFNPLPNAFDDNCRISLQEGLAQNAVLSGLISLRVEKLRVESICRKSGQSCSEGRFILQRKITRPGEQIILFSKADFMPSIGQSREEDREIRYEVRKRYVHLLRNPRERNALLEEYPDEAREIDWQHPKIIPDVIDRSYGLVIKLTKVHFAYNELDDPDRVLDEDWLNEAEFVIVRPETLGHASHLLNYEFDPKENKTAERCGDGDCGGEIVTVQTGDSWE